MDKTNKGRKTEKEVADYFLSKGYMVWRTRRSKFQKLDLFGLFDILAKNKKENVYIQVKTNDYRTANSICSEPNEEGMSILKFVCEYKLPNEKVLLWVKKEKKKAHYLYWIDDMEGIAVNKLDYNMNKITLTD